VKNDDHFSVQMYLKFEIIKHFLAPKHENILMENIVYYAFFDLYTPKRYSLSHTHP